MRICVTSVLVDDQDKALEFYTEVPLGEPLEMGGVTTAVFDDTCGNLIQIVKLS